jgi:hypothetical protein
VILSKRQLTTPGNVRKFFDGSWIAGRRLHVNDPQTFELGENAVCLTYDRKYNSIKARVLVAASGSFFGPLCGCKSRRACESFREKRRIYDWQHCRLSR